MLNAECWSMSQVCKYLLRKLVKGSRPLADIDKQKQIFFDGGAADSNLCASTLGAMSRCTRGLWRSAP